MEGSILGRVKLNQTIVFESWSAVGRGFNPGSGQIKPDNCV